MDAVTGVVLSGGLSRRMGGREKALLPFGSGRLLGRVIERVAPQVGRLVLSANGDPARFAAFGLPVIPDCRPGHPGPLAGVEAAFLATEADWLLSVGVDLPFLPTDLARRLGEGRGGEVLPVVAASGGRLHPVVCLWPREALAAIRSALDAGERRLMDWFGANPHRSVAFAVPGAGPDPFFNVNHPDALIEAERSVIETACTP